MTWLFKLLKVDKTHEENKPLILKHGIMVMPSVIYFWWNLLNMIIVFYPFAQCI